MTAAERPRRPRLEDLVRGVGNTHIDGVRFEPTAKRVRTVLAGVTIADSTRVMLLHERGHLPTYYFPAHDVRMELLEESAKRSASALKGEARYWSVRAGDVLEVDAAWAYPSPVEGCPDISKHIAFYWNAMDHWLEEDEEVFVHAHDPYHRIDILDSARRVQVVIDGKTVADTTRARFLFETTLPVRHYIPKADVRLDLLERSDAETACAYKGTTSTYWRSASAGGTVKDVAWCYEAPRDEVERIAGRIAFFRERVDAILVDGEPVERPATPWS